VIGANAGYYNETGNNNTIIGNLAGYLNTASNNIFIGYHSGHGTTSGADNIIIGYDIDAPVNTTSNYLKIGTIIQADMATSSMSVNGDLYANNYHGAGQLLTGVITSTASLVSMDLDLSASTASIRSSLNQEITNRYNAELAIGVSTAALAVSSGNINSDLQSYKTTVQLSTASIYSQLQSTGSALTAEISRAIIRENDIGISTGTNYAAINSTAIALTLETANRISGDNALGLSTAAISSTISTAAYLGNNQTFTGVNTFTSSVTASDFAIRDMILGSSTHYSVHDWMDAVQSGGLISGGEITDNGDGTVAIASGRGIMKTEDSTIGDTRMFNFSAKPSQTLADGMDSWVYISYNGGSPIISTATNRNSIRQTDQWVLGRVWRTGNDADIISGGIKVVNFPRTNHERLIQMGLQRMSGGIVTESGTRGLVSTAGSYYLGQLNIITPVNNTVLPGVTSTTTFKAYYRDGVGGWTRVVDQKQLQAEYDNDGSTAAVSSAKYGVYWVYVCMEGNIYILYGQSGSYNLAEAQNAQLPASIPDYLASHALLSAKIILKQGGTNFTQIESAYVVQFSQTLVTNHNDLANIDGGAVNDYQHLTTAQLAEVNTVGASTQALSLRINNLDAYSLSTGTSLSGDVSGLYNATVVADNSHLHNMSSLQNVLSSTTTVPVGLIDLSTTVARFSAAEAKASTAAYLGGVNVFTQPNTFYAVDTQFLSFNDTLYYGDGLGRGYTVDMGDDSVGGGDAFFFSSVTANGGFYGAGTGLTGIPSSAISPGVLAGSGFSFEWPIDIGAGFGPGVGSYALRVNDGIWAGSSITANAGFYGSGANLTGIIPSSATGNYPLNAATVTNGVYTNGTYSDPSWITKIGIAKVDTSTSAPLASPAFTGNVGIGFTNPVVALHVYGTSNTPLSSGATHEGIFRIHGSATPVIDFGTNSGSPYGGWIQVRDKDDNATTYPISLQPTGGSVGVGTVNPTQEFTVYGSDNNSTEINIIEPDTTHESIINFGDSLTGADRYIGRIAYAHSVNSMRLSVNGNVGSPEITINSGNVGIGTTAPATTLEVNGTVRIATSHANAAVCYIGTTGNLGYCTTSDASNCGCTAN